ncbi:hypothetical protein [Novosphingobium sp. FKTRR1]|uniref:hypothetical protein n=1 Tax=Novosphingobium sp. FKTRR1 TaxID=2879118 RepID=UPI001CF0C9BF|nr:hypothetical protein [Novosphingobium sp. FKTRR1]
MIRSARNRPLVLIGLGLLALPAACGAKAPSGAGSPEPRPTAQPVAPTAVPVPAASSVPAATADTLYPPYMPMTGLRRPAVKLFVKCDASRAAGREVYAGRDAASLYGRVEGGFEFVYEATDSSGAPCIYPFAPWMPQIVGSLQGTQYIVRSSVPGRRVTFRSGDEWASIGLHLYDIRQQRVHFEMRDIELDFPGAIQPQGALHLEAFGGAAPGLFTAVVRRSRIYGGKNALFVPPGQTMLYVEDSDLAGNVGTSADQMHTTYINGILVSHMRNSVWHGQHAWANMASGHQLKDKAYLRIYENVTVSNYPTGTTASAMPLIDATSFGFTWADGLRLERLRPAQDPREALVDLRSEIVYGPPQNYPWNLMVDPGWTMPANPLAALDKVYLSVFLNTTVRSFRTEPYVFALRPQGLGVTPGTTTVVGNEQTTRAQQRMVSLAFNTTGTFKRAYSAEGWTFTNPQLPPQAQWVMDRDAFARHALALIGR